MMPRSSIHRRQFPYTALALVCGCLLTACALAAAQDQNQAQQGQDKPVRALLVIGGCCHDYAAQKDILTKGISGRANVEWTVAYDPDKTTSHKNPVYESAD